MPAGVSWSEYLKFFAMAMIFAAAGAQSVHLYYKPLQDLNQLVEEELQRRQDQKKT